MAFIDGSAKVNSDAKVYSTRKEYDQEKEILSLKAENEKLKAVIVREHELHASYCDCHVCDFVENEELK